MREPGDVSSKLRHRHVTLRALFAGPRQFAHVLLHTCACTDSKPRGTGNFGALSSYQREQQGLAARTISTSAVGARGQPELPMLKRSERAERSQ